MKSNDDFSNELDDLRGSLLTRGVKVRNRFIGSLRVPLGTKKPFFTYRGFIPDDEVVWFDISRKEVLPICFIAIAGYLKSTLMKRLVYYYHHAGFRCLCLDNKGADMWMMNKKGKGRKLHPDESPDRLPVVSYVPSCLKEVLRTLPHSVSMNMEVFTVKLNDMIEDPRKARKYLKTLSISPSAIEKILEFGRVLKTVEAIVKQLSRTRMAWTARESAIMRLGNIISDNFFSKDDPPVDISRDWDARLIPVFSFFEEDLRYTALLACKIMFDAHHRSLSVDEPKLVIVDDAHLLAGADKDVGDYLSTKVMVDSLAIWRHRRFHMCFATQSPDLLHPSILDNCKYYLLGKMGNAKALERYVANPKIIDVVKNLDYRPREHIQQYCLVYPDRTSYETFYPFGSIAGHTW